MVCLNVQRFSIITGGHVFYFFELSVEISEVVKTTFIGDLDYIQIIFREQLAGMTNSDGSQVFYEGYPELFLEKIAKRSYPHAPYRRNLLQADFFVKILHDITGDFFEPVRGVIKKVLYKARTGQKVVFGRR